MKDVHVRASARNNVVIPFVRPRIERERNGEAWLVLRGDHAWLHGDRRQALRDRDRLDRAERFPWWRP